MKLSVKDLVLEEYSSLKKEKGKAFGKSDFLEACLKDLNNHTNERSNNTRLRQIKNKLSKR